MSSILAAFTLVLSQQRLAQQHLAQRRFGGEQAMGTWATAPLPAAEECDAEEGSAVVEFIFLGLLLLVPVIYLIVTAGQVQGASFAAVGAAESAAKVYVAAGDPVRAEQQARAAAELAFTDFGFEPEAMLLEIACSAQCLTPGSTVTAEVRFDVPLPLAPGIPGMEFAPVTVDSAATQMVERYG